jgi:uncharacterized protein
MDVFFERSKQKLRNTSTGFVRGLMDTIDWKSRLIGIKGARGVGKTTLLLQYLKLNLPKDHRSMYISLDNIWFSGQNLYGFAEHFVKQGGQYLLLDEVHKYPNWSQIIKNLYDDFPELTVVFTGSSLLEILNARSDLSRRAIVYQMQGFSFREYLNRNLGLNLPSYTLDDIVRNHVEISDIILKDVKVYEHFNNYLKHGYYPFYNESPGLYYHKLSEVVSMIMDIELPLLRGVDVTFIPKVKQLLQIISESAPFIPNITKLSERIGITRKSLLLYLHSLEESHLTNHLEKDAFGISKLQKPEKIFMENSNLMYALSNENIQTGHVRETFFMNQLKDSHQVNSTDIGDFLVDQKYIFEVGGKKKSFKQIEGLQNAYIVADGLEYGIGNKIPLWLFGFLY